MKEEEEKEWNCETDGHSYEYDYQAREHICEYCRKSAPPEWYYSHYEEYESER